LAFTDNTNVGTATATVTGIGNYAGTLSTTFAITAPDFADTQRFSIAAIADEVFTGSEITPVVVVSDGDTDLVEDTDYTLAFTDNTNVGTATATVTGIGNYAGTLSTTFAITAPDFADTQRFSIAAIADEVFTGSEITPVVVVSDGDTDLVEDTDYTLAFTDNTNVGTATATVTGIGNYAGTLSTTFAITAPDFADTQRFSIAAIADEVFTGSEITPVVVVSDGDTDLVEDTDYTLAFTDNTNVGTATATVTGIGNYAGTLSTTFAITAPDFADTQRFSIAAIADEVFTGSEITPVVVVSDGDTDLVEDTDYTLAFTDNTNVGTATATVTGIGNYAGTLSTTFAITAPDFADTQRFSIAAIADEVFTGSEITPVVVVSDGDTDLVEDTDYTLAFTDNTNVGTATATVTGIGNYAGTLSTTFAITAPDFADTQRFSIAAIADEVFTGSEITPVVVVSDGDTDLVEDTDYTLAFTDNTNVGTATATVTGIGNYAGTLSTTFEIVSGPISVAENGSILTGTDLNRIADGTEFATITLQLADFAGNIINDENIEVTFATTLGTLSQVNGIVTTNDSGIATITVTSTSAGIANITASITDPETGAVTNGSPVQVNFTAGEPTKLVINNPDNTDNQSAVAGSAVATPPSVLVTDANDNPVAGVEVTFVVESGDGSVNPTTAVTTNANGIAAVTSWTLGTTAGSNTLVASANELSSVTFNATGTAGVATQLVSITIQDDFIKLDGSTTISATILDANDNPVAGVEVYFVSDETDRATVTASATTDENGIAVATINGAGDGDGVVTITASIRSEDDNVGTSVSETATLTVLAPPSLTVNDLVTNDTTPTINGTSDLIGGTVTIVIDGKTFTATVDEDGTWSVNITPALTDGEYTFTASITDEAGNTTTETGTLTINTTAPELAVNDLVTNDTTPTINGTSDLIGGTVTVTIDGKTFTATVEEDGTWSVDITPALEDGEYEFTASITDEAGNETTATGTLTINTTAPELTADDLVTNDTTPTITGTSDLIGGTVTVIIDGKTFTATVDEDGTWSVNITPALTDGEYTFTASITDEAGHTKPPKPVR
jgi:hypothetical protein